ncbi:MAG: RagB/SusD family nutrient uptake outer membrane protein [Bacteroidetes bacterium]|nr:RagB/SusD family nutrient uptake outer membrane protein [Bacteroidota bacterium]
MKQNIAICILAMTLFACHKLDIAPVSIIQDQQIFTTPGGVEAYMSGLYIKLPIEDFKFNGSAGYNQFSFIDNINNYSGEGMTRAVGSEAGIGNQYYADGYAIIRQANYFLQTMPQYKSTATPQQFNSWMGESYFLRAFTYFELAKRYGGVPIIRNVQNYPQQSLDELQVPRNSEQEVYDFIESDLDSAYLLLGATSENRGRANKYTAAALECRAMLYAGSIAKYNSRNVVDPATNKRVQGIDPGQAVRYFKASQAAAMNVQTGGYALYRLNSDKEANYINLFFDATSTNKECIFAKEYSYGNAGHSYDVFAVPHQEQAPIGYSSYIDVTEDFVELFDGLPKNADGSLQTTDSHGNYIYYGMDNAVTQTPYSTFNTTVVATANGTNVVPDTVPTGNNTIINQYTLFKNAEPRLLATVIVPGAVFKGQAIDIRRGIYTGPIGSGIQQFPLTSSNPYTGNPNIVPCTALDGTPVVNIGNPAINVPANTKLASGGLSGIYGSRNSGTISGYHVRKYSNQMMATALITGAASTQPWIEIRYAEVLLSRAEADWELNAAGQTDQNYMQDAFTCINDIRDRAGAVLLNAPTDLADVNVIRKERRKELAFENKNFWDIIRWRTADQEINNRVWNVLNPIYVVANGKYIFDRRPYEGNSKFTFNVMNYYQQLPSSEITKNPKLFQNQ